VAPQRLVDCNRVLNAKGFVFPTMHADILKERMKRSVIKMSNHWVTMTDIDIYDKKGKKLGLTDSNIKKVDEVKPTFFTWGDYYSGRIEKGHYKKFVWLYIVCEPFTNQGVIEQLKKVS
jgi:hypothetical protein